jgi:hypothetical protein
MKAATSVDIAEPTVFGSIVIDTILLLNACSLFANLNKTVFLTNFPIFEADLPIFEADFLIKSF